MNAVTCRQKKTSTAKSIGMAATLKAATLELTCLILWVVLYLYFTKVIDFFTTILISPEATEAIRQ